MEKRKGRRTLGFINMLRNPFMFCFKNIFNIQLRMLSAARPIKCYWDSENNPSPIWNEGLC